MRKSRQRITIGFLAVLILLGLWVGYNTYPIWRDYLGPPPVNFLRNELIALSLYQEGKQAAVVFTNDDLGIFTPPAELQRLRDCLKRIGLKGTFFVIPSSPSGERPDPEDTLVGLMREMEEDGHEIAQHGFCHYCRKNEEFSVKTGAEMLCLNYAETVERLRKGREILTDLGFPPAGHRSPCFSGTKITSRALDDLGYLYGSDFDLPPTTPRTLFTRSFTGRIFFPYHPEGLRLLQVTCQTDPTVHPGKAFRVFERVYRRGGVFTFLTHLPQITEEENLVALEEFSVYLKTHSVWICTLSELCRWWRGREELRVSAEVKGSVLTVTCDNPTPYPLEDIEITFLRDEAEEFRVVDGDGRILAGGVFPSSRQVRVTIPGLPEGGEKRTDVQPGKIREDFTGE